MRTLDVLWVGIAAKMKILWHDDDSIGPLSVQEKFARCNLQSIFTKMAFLAITTGGKRGEAEYTFPYFLQN